MALSISEKLGINALPSMILLSLLSSALSLSLSLSMYLVIKMYL